MNDDRQERETPTYVPRPIDVGQLVADLKAVVSPALYTDEGFARIAEELHARGVRSKLDTSISCPWCEKQFPGPDERGRIPFHKVAFMTDWMECQGSKRELMPNGGLLFPSPSFEGLRPGATPALLREFVGAVILIRTDPDSGFTGEAWGKLTPTSHGVAVTLDPNARIVPLLPMSEVPGHAQPVIAPGVPHPIPDRPLPDGVYNVIHFLQFLEPVVDWKTTVHDGQGHRRTLTREDLKAVLAEIPDAVPHYPTIWAYEQACRTIRERDQRIADALMVLSQRPPDPEDCIKVIRDAHETLRMPRTLPVEQRELSEVARAFEACDTDDDAEVGDAWSGIARTLRDEALRLADVIGDQQDDLTSVVLTDAAGELVPCGTCSAFEPPIHTLAVGRSGRGWPRCAQHLVEDALDDAGLEKGVKRCSSCSHLASSHYEDGSGCSVTIRDVGMGADNHCPCTFDARSVHRG